MDSAPFKKKAKKREPMGRKEERSWPERKRDQKKRSARDSPKVVSSCDSLKSLKYEDGGTGIESYALR